MEAKIDHVLRIKLDAALERLRDLGVSAADLYAYTIALDAADMAAQMGESYKPADLLEHSIQDEDEMFVEGEEILQRALEFANAYDMEA